MFDEASSGMFDSWEKYPEGTDGKLSGDDYASGKYVKLWQGPQHPGITGNMSVELTISGDEIIKATTHVGYLHRAFEKLMERRRYIQCFPICDRICVPEPDINEYCLARATEELAGIEIPETAKWLRTLDLEMARIANLLAGLGGQAATMGMGVIGQWQLQSREYILDRFEELTGGRIYHMYMLPGGVRSLLPDGFKKRMLESLEEIEESMARVDKVMFNNAVFNKRTQGVAIIKPEWVDEYGLVGVNARSAGFARDVRKDNPYLVYDKLDFDIAVSQESDIYTRSRLRYIEILLSIDLIRQILDRMPQGKTDFMAKVPNVLNWKVPPGETYVKLESARGEFGYYMVSDGSIYPRRIHTRGASYTTGIPFLEKILIGQNFADVSTIMVSLQICPPEIER